MSEAANIRAEIEAMPAEALRELALSGVWGIHPLRVQLDTAEHLVAARRAISNFDRNHGGDLWHERRSVSRETIHERRLAALARAWERLGGGRELLFHVRGEWRPAEDRPVLRRHLGAPEIAIDENPRVPEAPYLEHPISLAEAARFAIVTPVLRCCVQLAEAAVRAFDVLGQPTTALHRRSLARRHAPQRHVVWRVRSAAHSAHSRVRMALLTAEHLIGDLGAAGRSQLDIPALARHPQAWGAIELAAIGALAWRRASELGLPVRASRGPGPRLLTNPAVVARRYRELDDPFTPLLAILRLGCRLHAFSDAATTLELQPLD